ncbi:MAG: hypothetical protein IPM42_19585 [Saprospiraceae bacterium]|nr:hypothetical protein [Saprospiraceae bacterium]
MNLTSNFQPHNTASNFINNGTINWNEGQLDGGIGGQVLTNTGTLNLNSSGNILGMSVVNTGTITRGTPGSVSFSQTVDNQVSGIFTIPNGVTFSFDTGSTITQSGTFTVDGSLNFSATGTHIINTVNSFSGTGTINIINSPTFNGSVGWQPIIPVVNHAGTLSGSAVLTIDVGTVWNWSTGNFTLSNPITNNGTMNLTSNFQPHNTASNFINNGTINWNEGQLDGGIGGQVLTNTGTLNLNSSGNILGMSVVNTGTITRGTPGSVSFSQTVDNQVSGIFTIPNGVTFSFDTGSTITQSGTFTVDGSLNFSATGTHIINTVNSFSGTGTINIINSPTFNGSVGWQPIIPVVNHSGTLAGNVSLIINPATTWNWSTGNFTLSNPITNNGTMILIGSSQHHNTASNIINNGTINWNEGHLDQGVGGQVLTNNGTLNLNSTGFSLGMQIINTGTITRTTATGGINFTQSIDNQVGGTIIIPSNVTFTFGTGSSLTQSGTITVDGTLSYGAISVTQNALINLNGTCNITAGTHNFGTNGGFTGSGTLSATGGTINFNSGSTHSGSLSIIGAIFNDNIGLSLVNVSLSTNGTYGGTGNGIVNGTFSWTQGTISGSNLLTVNGTGSATTTSAKTLSGSKELRIAGSVTFTNTPLSMSGTAKLSVESGGTLTWDVNTSSNTVSGAATNIVEVKSGGTFIKSGANLLEINAKMDMNNGSIQVLGGILRSSGDGSPRTITNGTISIDATGTMQFSRLNVNIIHNLTGTVISGSGKLEVSNSATANFESGTQINISGTISATSSGIAHIKTGVTVTLTPNIQINSGTITDDVGITSNDFTLSTNGTYGGSGNGIINGSFSWTQGTITGSNLLTVNGAGSVTSLSSKTLSGSKDLRIAGTTTFTNTPLSMSGTAKLSVESGSTLTWDATSSNTVSGAATNIVEVKSGGTFIKSGANLLEINARMDMNNGSIQVLEGILRSSGDGSPRTITNGTISIDATGTMQFSRLNVNIIHNIIGTVISGSGKLEVSNSATANFESGTQINISGTIAATSSGIANIKTGVTVTLTPNIQINSGIITDDVGITSNDFTLSTNGTYGGSGNGIINGTFSWSQGTITGSNLLTVNGAGSVTTLSSKTLSGSKELRIAGSVTFTNTPLSMSGTAKLSVEIGGTLTWDVTTSSNTVSGTATNVVEVKSGGTFIKSGANLLEINAKMDMNNGSIQVLGGILRSSGDGSPRTITNGTISIDATGTMQFSRLNVNILHNIIGTVISGSGKLEVSNSATANFESGTQINISGTIAATSSGIANIKTGVTVTLTPNIQINSGTITDDVGITSNDFTLSTNGTYGGSGNGIINGTFSWTQGTISGSNLLTVNGTGSVTTTSAKTLSGSKELRIAGFATFTNTPLSMSGTAKLSVESGGTLTWDVNTSSNTVSGAATNIVEVKSGGTFIKTGANLLEIRAQMDMNNGSIQVIGGILNSSGSGSPRTLINGTISIGATATMEFSGSVTNIIHNISGTIISGAGELKVSTSATANFESGTQINVSGTIVSTGSSSRVKFKSGVTVSLSPNLIMINGGIIEDSVGITSNNFTLNNGTYFTNSIGIVNGTFSWSHGYISGSGSLLLNSTGSISTNSTKVLGNSSILRIAGNISIPNNTVFNLESTAKIIVLTGGICSGGTGTIQGTAATLIEVQNGGIWEKTANPNLTINPPFVNQGLLRGANLITFNSTFTNTNGTVSPGLSPGVFVLNKFDNTNATLIMEIGGSGLAGVDRDSLRITGSPALLNGTLDLRLINGFVPDSNDVFNLVSLQSGYGTFQSLVSTGIPNDSMSWKLEYETTLVKARFCPMWYVDQDGDGFGDYNNNGKFCDCIAAPVGYSRDYTDCDDTDPLEYPGQTWYIDTDSDNYGGSSVVQCLRPTDGFVISELSGTGTDDCDDNDPLEYPGQTWYIDADSDNYGGGSVVQCLRPTDGFVITELSGTGTDDCDDNDPLEYPGQTWYIDADGDNYGATSVVQCLRPTDGFVISELSGTGTDDCDDTDPLEFPGQTWYIDADGDNFGGSSVVQCLRPADGFVIGELSGTGTDDCDDNDPQEFPGQTWCIDADGDNFGGSSVVQCLRPADGFVIGELSGTGTDDCDDNDPLEYPGQTWYINADGDNFGGSSVVQCLRPTDGFVISELSGTGTDDCDDNDPLEYPGQTWYIDGDGDNYGGSSMVQCLRPADGFVIGELSGTGTDDCDDNDPLEYPGQTWYIDADGDNFGGSSVVQCLRPADGFVIGELSGTGTDDCDDNDPQEFPGQTWYIDSDSDNYGGSSVVQCLRPTDGFVISELSGTGTDDCDDNDPLEYPGQTWFIDGDGDNYGGSSMMQCLRPADGFVIGELSGTGTDDCDDNDPLEYPGQTWYIDGDGDNYGGSSVVQCLRPTDGFVISELSGTGTDDCDDNDPLEYPGQTWYIDADSDNYGGSSVVQCLRPTDGFVISELSGTGTDDCDDTDALVFPNSTFIKSYANGNWDDPHVWLCGSPGFTIDSILITHNVLLNVTSVNLTANIEIVNGMLSVLNNNSLNVGNPMQSSQIILKDSSTINVNVNGLLNIVGKLVNNSGSIINNEGEIRVKK